MSQGMFSAVTGIRNNQTRMNVIANNIANVNTVGFKSSTANFATVFSQTITGGTTPNGLSGGTNPMQIGNGAAVTEIASIWNQGGAQFTGRNTDVMIQGEGFFVVQRVDVNNGNSSTDYYLTRAGNFSMDADGYLTTTAGLKVRGTSQVSGSNPLTQGNVKLPRNIQICKDLDVNGNTVETHFGSTLATNADFAGVMNAGAASQRIDNVVIRSFSFGADGSINAVYSNGDKFSVRTQPSTGSGTNARREIVHTTAEGTVFTAGFGSGIPADTLNIDGLCSQLSGGAPTYPLAAFDGGTSPATDPGTPGGPSNQLFAMQGMQFQMQAASVSNPGGLIFDSNSNYLVGANSGATEFGTPSANQRGSLLPGSLESSNVDIAGEFTLMVITQRGIEAASRVIRAQSEVLQTVISIVP